MEFQVNRSKFSLDKVIVSHVVWVIRVVANQVYNINARYTRCDLPKSLISILNNEQKCDVKGNFEKVRDKTMAYDQTGIPIH